MPPSASPRSSIASRRRARSRPSTSKRNGLAARFSASWTSVAAPSRTATRPQHSAGKSRRAWSTMRSSSACAIRKRLLRLQRGALVLVHAPRRGVVLARERRLELAQPPADGAPGLGQLLGAEDDQGDRQDDDELHRTDVRHVFSYHQTVVSSASISSTGRV